MGGNTRQLNAKVEELGLEQGITARLAEDKDELIFATGGAPFSLLEGPAA